MKHLLLSAAALVFSAGVAFADDIYDPIVIDPVSGEAVLLSTIDQEALTEEQLAELQAQLDVFEDEDGAKYRYRVSEDNGQGAMYRYRYEGETEEEAQHRHRHGSGDDSGSGSAGRH